MNDHKVVEILSRIDVLQSKLSDLICEIQDSDHPKAAEIAQDLFEQCWFAASAEHVGVEYLDKSRWTLQEMGAGKFHGRIVSRQQARKRGIETID